MKAFIERMNCFLYIRIHIGGRIVHSYLLVSLCQRVSVAHPNYDDPLNDTPKL